MVAERKGIVPTELVEIEGPVFLDGPVSERVAIIDFDEKGAVRPGSVFTPPAGDRSGLYAGANQQLPSDAA